MKNMQFIPFRCYELTSFFKYTLLFILIVSFQRCVEDEPEYERRYCQYYMKLTNSTGLTIYDIEAGLVWSDSINIDSVQTGESVDSILFNLKLPKPNESFPISYQDLIIYFILNDTLRNIRYIQYKDLYFTVEILNGIFALLSNDTIPVESITNATAEKPEDYGELEFE